MTFCLIVGVDFNDVQVLFLYFCVFPFLMGCDSLSFGWEFTVFVVVVVGVIFFHQLFLTMRVVALFPGGFTVCASGVLWTLLLAEVVILI